MKRLNPETNQPFKLGDVRDDGYRFESYKSKKNLNGFFYENWYSPNKYEQMLNKKRESCRKYSKENPDKNRERAAKWRKNNSEKHLEFSLRWQRNNPEKANARNAKRRAARLKRTVAWADHEAIKTKYTTARYLSELTGEQYHVDHIIPLQGELVSGLHVENNLRVVPSKVNLSKGNSFDVELRK